MARSFSRQLGVATALALVIGCGSSSPTSPSGSGGGTGGGPAASGATITISGGVVSPKTVTINAGQSVTFVNNDGQAHQIASNPHPAHSDCPAINALGAIGAGQTKATEGFTTARSCGFHDHNEPSNSGLQGTITIR